MLTKLLVRKTLRFVLLVFAVLTLSFALVSASPIDPIAAYVGPDVTTVSADQMSKIAERWGLNDPPLVRYGKWWGNILQGNLGTSQIFSRPVVDLIFVRFLVSLPLMMAAWATTGLLGFALGMIAGAFEQTWLDRALRFYAFTLASAPTFWIALIMLSLFAVALRWFPLCCATPIGLLPDQISLADRARHLVLPALTLSLVGTASIVMYTRQKMIEAMHSDYVLYAIANGESRWGIVWHHAMRNVLAPAIVVQFASFSELFGGAVLAETVFSYPGLGDLSIRAGLQGDVPLLLGIVLFTVAFVYVGNLAADVLTYFIDPVRSGERQTL